MMPVQFTLNELQQSTTGVLHPRGADRSIGVTGISTDTRTLQTGEAYLAIQGPQFDGHTFLAVACERGASVLIVHTLHARAAAKTHGVPVIGVQDTVAAYGALARFHRQRFTIPVVAITGSCGKTTTKEYLGTLLNTRRVLKNPKTENNAIGVPRVLLRLTETHEVAIIELGSNHPGEIASLTHMVQPTHAIVTNIGPAHLEFFGSLDGVAEEKLALLDLIPASGGIVLNADDTWMMQWLGRQTGGQHPPVTTFGRGPSAQVWLSDVRSHSDGLRFVINDHYTATLPATGVHHALDALAAMACAEQLGLRYEETLPRLPECRNIEWRMERIQLENGPTLLCDCYNANPLSMAQAIQTLASYPATGRRILVVGEMRELGDFTTTAHCDVGQWAMESELDGVVAIGHYASIVIAGAHTHMQHAALLMAYQTVEEACTRVPELLRPGDVILIKGSRSAQLERLATSCQARWSQHAVLAQQSA